MVEVKEIAKTFVTVRVRGQLHLKKVLKSPGQYAVILPRGWKQKFLAPNPQQHINYKV